MFGKRHNKTYAGVAQLVEQLICNQQVAGSSPITSSTNRDKLSGLSLKYGRVPEWPKGADCKSVVFDFNGSNPFSPTTQTTSLWSGFFVFRKSKQTRISFGNFACFWSQNKTKFFVTICNNFLNTLNNFVSALLLKTV